MVVQWGQSWADTMDDALTLPDQLGSIIVEARHSGVAQSGQSSCPGSKMSLVRIQSPLPSGSLKAKAVIKVYLEHLS